MKGFTLSTAAAVTVPSGLRSQRGHSDTRAPRVLVLTSGLGCGHLRAAEAVALAVQQLEPRATCRPLDFWTLMNPGVAATIKDCYLELVLDHPDLYARLHGLDERTWRRVIENDIPPPLEVVELIELLTRNGVGGRKSAASLFEWALGPYASDLLLYPTACAAMPTSTSEVSGTNVALLRLAMFKWAFQRLQGRLQQRLLEFEPDVVVATQMVPAALMSALKQQDARWQDVPLIGVLTDFGAHDYWSQPGIDVYCVPHAALAGQPLEPRARNGHEDAAAVLVTGVPLMPAFHAPASAAQARQRLGLDEPSGARRPIVLVLGGGLGLGVDAIVEALRERLVDCTILVMAGNNTKLVERSGWQARPDDRTAIRVEPWTDDMATFIAAADLVVGKSGGLTVAEVLACGRPLLAAKSLRGQESFNVRFIERMQVGRFAAPDALAPLAQDWLADPERLQELQTRAWHVGRRDGAQAVARCALELAERSRSQGAWTESP